MSSLRYDRAQCPRPAGRIEQADREEQPWLGNLEAQAEYGICEDELSFLSVVIPSKNEAANLSQLVAEVVGALRPLCGGKGGARRLVGFEVLIVDDASIDETGLVLRDLAKTYPELRAISLIVDGGQSSATIAGIRAARGNWIGTLDADLQNDPLDLVRLWNALPGHDVALGWRFKRGTSCPSG